jgi:DNA-binding response OmpR family regulator
MEKKLLIVEDDNEIADIITEVLCDVFSHIIFASTGEQALRYLKEEHFALITLDINLNGRNGAEVVKFLGDTPENPNTETPILILSGIITPQFIEKNTMRFAGILNKPFNNAELYNVVENILNN